MREVTIRVRPDGKTTVDMVGFAGQGCDAVKTAIAMVLQQTVLDDTVKPEYFQAVSAEEELQVGR